MTSRLRALPVALGLLASPAALAQPAPTPPAELATEAAVTRLTLSEALALGASQSPDLAIARRSIDAAEARVSATKALRLPTVKLDVGVLRWNESVEIPFGVANFVVREQITSSTSVGLTEHISGQVAIHHMIQVERAGLEATRHDQRAAESALSGGVAQLYLGALLARAQVEIAATRVAQVEAQLGRARALAEGGVLKQVDVLRLEAALAAARREGIAARSNAESAAEGLALTLGLPAGSRVDVVDDLPAEPKAPPLDEGAALAGSLGRAELAASRARARQAVAGEQVARSQLLPSIVAMANYTYNTGAGELQPEDAWYVGLGLQWNVWDWGHNYGLYKEAGFRREQATLAAAREVDRARVEVRREARDARAAFESLAVARAGLAAADEAYRIQEVRFAEGDTTTTDLLQAQAEQAEARLAGAAARHAYFARLAALAAATGARADTLLAQTR